MLQTRLSHKRFHAWLWALLLLFAPLSGSSAVDDACWLEIDQFQLKSSVSGEFEPHGSDLALGPRLRPGLAILRFELPPSPIECWLQVDRTSMFHLVIDVEGLDPVSFDFFRPGPNDLFSAAGFTVPIPPHETPRQVMLEITHLGSVATKATRIDKAELLARERRVVAIQALSFQVPIIMALLMLVFWIRLHDRALAAYIALMLSFVLIASSLDGTLYRLPGLSLLAGLNSMAHMFLMSLFGLAVVGFFREFLSPLDRSASITVHILAALFAFTAISSALNITVFNAVVMHLTVLVILITVPLLFWHGVRSLRAGNRLAIYFLVGWSLPVIVIPLRMMAEYGLIEWGFWIRYAPRLALMVETLIFALGLADRFLRFRIERDRAEQSRLQSERALTGYRRLAWTDALTGIASRRALDEEMARWTDSGQPGSVLFLDIDHFKDFNDSFGHAAGDAALRAVAERLRELLPRETLLARYGGEEIVALLPDRTLPIAKGLAEHVRQDIERSQITPDGRALTVSIGVAERLNDERADQAVARADAALYTAKNDGRNRVVSAAAMAPM